MKMKSDQGYTDKLIISFIKKGDEKAFALLYDKYWEQLYYIAYKHLQSAQDCEDLVHEVFIDLWKNRKKIEIRSSVSNYIFTALKYKIFRLYDAQRVRQNYAKLIASKEPETSNTTEKELSFKELYDLIEQNIQKLPEKCRLVFKLRKIEEYSVEEVAEKLNISPNTVHNQVTKASKILKQNLKEHLNSFLVFFFF